MKVKEIFHRRKPGLPKDLQEETFEALRPIYLKYISMKKKHMSRNRIVGIMHIAMMNATSTQGQND